MIIPQDDLFREEAKRYSLKWNCEDCARFVEGDERCAHGFPTEKHLRVRYLDPDAGIHFCKEFTL